MRVMQEELEDLQEKLEYIEESFDDDDDYGDERY